MIFGPVQKYVVQKSKVYIVYKIKIILYRIMIFNFNHIIQHFRETHLIFTYCNEHLKPISKHTSLKISISKKQNSIFSNLFS